MQHHDLGAVADDDFRVGRNHLPGHALGIRGRAVAEKRRDREIATFFPTTLAQARAQGLEIGRRCAGLAGAEPGNPPLASLRPDGRYDRGSGDRAMSRLCTSASVLRCR